MELLITMVVSSIITSGLLYLVMEIMQVDRREASLDQVQQDMQRAIDYIRDDLQQALYVYSDPADVERIETSLQDDRNFPDRAEDTTVLVFWRVDPIEDNLPTVCVDGHRNFDDSDPNFAQCQSLRVRQASYTLVAYVQRTNDGNRNWPGQSRLIRYELSKYRGNTANMVIREGYRDPANLGDSESSFEDWTPDLTRGNPSGSSAALVDFVDNPTATLNRSPLSDPTEPCSTYGTDASGNSLYQVMPSAATTTDHTSFFACVRSPDTDSEERTNQDVYVFLRGNAYDAQPGAINMANSESALPILETRVLVRGVVDKRI